MGKALLRLTVALAALAVSIFTTLHVWEYFVVPTTGWAPLTVSGVFFLSALIGVFNTSLFLKRNDKNSYSTLVITKYVFLWILIGLAHLFA